MKKQTFSLLSGAVLAVALLLVSCHSSYEVTKVEGGRIGQIPARKPFIQSDCRCTA